jgi:hypothetical protein
MKTTTDMRKWSNDILRIIASRYKGSVINVGANNDGDKSGGHYRDYFTNASRYRTLDPNIPKADFNKTEQLWDNNFDIVLSLWVLEHIWDFHYHISELKRICQRVIIIAVPTFYQYHPAPNDYWRFTRESMRKLLEPEFEISLLKEFNNKHNQGGLMIVGRKRG